MIIELEGNLLSQATIISRLKGIECEEYIFNIIKKDVDESKHDLFKLFDQPLKDDSNDREVLSDKKRVNFDKDGPVHAYKTHQPYNELSCDENLMVWNSTPTGVRDVLPLYEFIYVCDVFALENKHRHCNELANKFKCAPSKINKLAVEFLKGNVDSFLNEQLATLGNHTFGKHDNELYIDGERTRLNLQEVNNIVRTVQDKGNIGRCMFYYVEEWGCRAIDVLPLHVMIICANYKNSMLIDLINLGGGGEITLSQKRIVV